MPQGIVKKAKAPAPSRKPSNPGQKKGQRTIAPKKATLMKQIKLKKKLSAGLITKTEQSLAAKAGHLELLKGGKGDRAKGKPEIKKTTK